MKLARNLQHPKTWDGALALEMVAKYGPEYKLPAGKFPKLNLEYNQLSDHDITKKP